MCFSCLPLPVVPLLISFPLFHPICLPSSTPLYASPRLSSFHHSHSFSLLLADTVDSPVWKDAFIGAQSSALPEDNGIQMWLGT